MIKKVIRNRKKIGAASLAILLSLQALNTTMLAATLEARKVNLADTYGKYYNVDVAPETTKQEVILGEEEVLTKEAPYYANTSDYEGYKEVIEKRTVYSKTYEIEKGKYVEEMFFEPIHKEVNGKLEDIDNTLKQTSKNKSMPVYENEDGLYTFKMKDNTIQITNENGKKMEWVYPDGEYSRYDVKDNVILFTEVYKDIDMQYVLMGDTIHTSYIIQNETNQNEIRFQIKLNGLQAEMKDTTIDFVDGDGVSQFKVVKPITKDSFGKRAVVDTTMESIDANTIEVTYTLNKVWMGQAERKYPVQMGGKAKAASDLSWDQIGIQSRYVRQRSPNAISDYDDLIIGFDDFFWGGAGSYIGIARTFLHVAQPDLGANQRVVRATLKLFKEQDGAGEGVSHLMGKNIDVYMTSGYVDPAVTTWNNQPTDLTFLSKNNVEGGKDYYSFDVTTYISDRYKGLDKTLVLKAENESSSVLANVFSSEGTPISGQLPKLSIEYQDDYDVDPAMGIENFDSDMRIYAKENVGFYALSFDGKAKPYYNVIFDLMEKTDGGRISGNQSSTSTAVASTKFIQAIMFSNPLGSLYRYYEPYQYAAGDGVNYTTNYILANVIPKFDTLYDYKMKVSNGSESSTREFYSDEFIKYKVKAGDTLKSIAAYYGVTVDDLKKYNNLINNMLQEGQILLVVYRKLDNPKVPRDVYTPPIKIKDYQAEYVYKGPRCYGNCGYGDPVNTVTGNFYHETSDFTLKDYGNITFHRYYNSKGEKVSNIFGNGFTTTLEQYLTLDKDGNLLYFSGDGKIFKLEKDGATYRVDPTNRIQFTKTSTGYEIKHEDTGQTFIFDDFGTLVTMVEKNGFTSQVVYNEYGQITGMQLGDKQITFVYNENNLVKEVVLPDGSKTQYQYDSKRNLTTFTDVLGYEEVYSYDANRYMTSVKDRNGTQLAKNTYDANGIVLKQEDGNGNTLVFNYTPNKTTITHDDGTKIAYEYSNFQTTKVIQGDGSSAKYEYDSFGNISKKTDETGAVTTYQYDKHNMKQVNYPDGSKETYTYNTQDQMTSYTHKDGSVERYEYVGKDLVRKEYSDGTYTNYTYDGNHRIQSETNHLGVSKSYTYAGNQITRVTHSNGLVENFTYDVSGNMKSESDSEGKQITYEYNQRNQLIKKNYQQASSEQWKYDGNGNTIEYVDRKGGKTTYTYDKNNNLIQSEKGGLKVTKQYNGVNQVIKEVDEQGNSKQYEYDANFRKVKEIDAYGNATKYTYDALGQVKTTTDTKGNVETNHYDHDRLIETEHANGLTTTYTYDAFGREVERTEPNGKKHTKTYQGIHLIQEVTPMQEEINYTYDRFGREISKRVKQDGIEVVYETTYDANGNVASKKRDGVVENEYTYDVYGRVKTTRDALGNVSQSIYDYDGNLIEEKDALGHSNKKTYDGLQNVIAETDKNGNTKTRTYDVNNFLVSETDELGNVVTYTYNNKGQQVTRKDPYGVVSTYIYDAYGNVIETQIEGKRVSTKSYDKYGREVSYRDSGTYTTKQYDSFDRVVEEKDAFTGRIQTKIYDVYGNVVEEHDQKGKTTTYTYDSFQRVVESVDVYGRVSKNTYDGRNQIIKKETYQGVETSSYDAYGNVIETTDVLGNTTTYTYDAKNQKIKEVSDQSEFSYTYDAVGNVLETQDHKRSTTTKNTYDAQGNVMETRDALGNVTKTVYDGKQQVIESIDANGGSHKTMYDANGNVIKEIDALGQVTQTVYNAFGQVSQEIDSRGFETKYIYDDAFRVKEIIDKKGNTIQFTYNEQNQIEKEVDGNHNTTRKYYDIYNQVTKEIKPNGNVLTKTYDVLGNVIEEQEEDRITETTYDANGNIKSVTKNDVVQSENRYNKYNQLIEEKNAKGEKTTYTYDKYGNVVKTNDKGKVVENEYNALGEVIQTTTNDTYVETFTYDALGRVVSTHVNGILKEAKTYDGNGNAVAVETNGIKEQLHYDANNQLIETYIQDKKTNGFVLLEKNTYDASGNVTQKVDGVGNVTKKSYDANNNVIVEVDAKGNENKYEYDANNNLIKAENANERSVVYTYDDNNKVILKDVNGKNAEYTYNTHGELLKERNEYGYEHTYSYDDFGNQIRHQKPDGTSITMKYDALQRKVQEGTIHTKYDIQGNVIEVTNKQGTTYYTYDSFGNMLSSKDPNGNTVRYTYDDNHNITSKIYANTTITYTYTDYGQIESIQKDGKEVAHYRYNNQQEVIERIQKDIVTSKEYDANGNVIKQHTTQGNQVIFDATYTYDANQNLVEEVINGKTNTYDYNVFDELVSSKKYIDGELVETSYAFDLQGNQITNTSNGEYKKYTYNEANQVETIETEKGYIRYEYDDNGNIKQKQNEDYTKETYTYNEQDELTTLTQGQYVYTYAYDGEGNRIQQTKKDTHDYFYSVWYDYFVGVDVVSDQRVANAFDELRLQARRKEETGGTCTLKKQDFYDILYQKEPEITKYTLDRNTTYPEVLADDEVYVYGDSLLVHDDVQVIGGKNASVVAEVDGSTTKHYSYSDYGESTNLNRHAYNGEVQDETGLIYLRARYYDPQTARFIQIDNHYTGEKQQVNTQSRYVYTLGNPYKYVDRDGKRAMMMDSGGGSDDTNPYIYGFKEEWLSLSLLEFELRISKINAKARSTAKSMWNEYQRSATLYDENPPTDNQLERMINADQEPKTPVPNVDCNKNWFDHLVDGAKDVGAAIWDGVELVGETVIDVLAKLGAEIVDTVIGMATNLWNFINDNAFAIQMLLLGVIIGILVIVLFVPSGGTSLAIPGATMATIGGGTVVVTTTTTVVEGAVIGGGIGAVYGTVVQTITNGSSSGSSSSGGQGTQDSENNHYNGNRNPNADFKNGSSLDKHFADHGIDFKATSSQDYLNKARSFFNNPPKGFESFSDSSGWYYQYDPTTNTFGIINQYGGISTFFKPNTGVSYWIEQMAKYMP